MKTLKEMITMSKTSPTIYSKVFPYLSGFSVIDYETLQNKVPLWYEILFTSDSDNYVETIAKALYDAGYRKVDDFEAEDERLREVIRQLNTDYNRAWERLKSDCREIGELKAENKQLKTECALLDDELRIARQDIIDVLNELKAKSYVNNYCREVVEVEKIDELLKEYEK